MQRTSSSHTSRRPAPRRQRSCPVAQKVILDNSFIENRTQLLDIAAFMDRMDRSAKKDAISDFRYTAFRKAVKILSSTAGARVERISLQLSDTTRAPLPTLDRKSALGAFNVVKKKCAKKT